MQVMHRIACILFLTSLSAPVLANGAMGLGLEMWDMRYWLAYVIATIFLEAWLIGRWMHVGWLQSIAVSTLANAVTALLCTSLCAVGSHSAFVGSRLNPNPFWNGVWLLTWLAIPSAVVETGIWARVRRSEEKAWPLLRRSLVAHLVGIPLAMCILLIPERPYAGLESFTHYYRRLQVSDQLKRDLQAYVASHNRLPKAITLAKFMEEVPPAEGAGDPDRWTMVYLPTYDRFSTGETARLPYEYNARIAGLPIKNLDNGDERFVWLLRPPAGSSMYTRGLAVDMTFGEVRDFRLEELLKMPDR